MRTPPLRNIELSAPYFADGHFRTPEEVIAFYNRGGDFTAGNKDPRIVPLGLTPQQMADIAVFLRRPPIDVRVRDETGPFARPALYSDSNRVPQVVRAGTPGISGATPRLTAIEPPLAGSSSFTIGIDGGRGSAQATVVLATSDPAAPDAPVLLTQTVQLSPLGAGSVHLALPNDGNLEGVPLYLRVFVADGAAAGGHSATASVRFTLLGIDDFVLRNGCED